MVKKCKKCVGSRRLQCTPDPLPGLIGGEEGTAMETKGREGREEEGWKRNREG